MRSVDVLECAFCINRYIYIYTYIYIYISGIKHCVSEVTVQAQRHRTPSPTVRHPSTSPIPLRNRDRAPVTPRRRSSMVDAACSLGEAELAILQQCASSDELLPASKFGQNKLCKDRCPRNAHICAYMRIVLVCMRV
jgi:hypothetical protein